MTILGIETSQTACSVALYRKGEIVQVHREAPMQQAKLLLGMIDELLRSHDTPPNQLDAIAFGCRPGSFTGLRIAASVAQGLGYALDLPLIPISSLAALAQTLYGLHGWRQITVAVDARIQEVFLGSFQVGSDGLAVPAGKESLVSPSELASTAPEWCRGGNAWHVYSVPSSGAPSDTTSLPTAAAIIELAMPKFNQKDWVLPEDVSPVYLRDEVAVKENKR